MNEQTTLDLKGEIDMFSYIDGKLVSHQHIKNLVVTSGRNLIASRLISSGSNSIGYIALGTGTRTPALSDTALQAETQRSLINNASANGNVITLSATFNFSSNTTISEMGVFNNTNGGTMFSRATFYPSDVVAGEVRVIIWSITIN